MVGSKELQKLSRTTTNINTILERTVTGLASSTETYSNWGQTLRGRKLMVMIDGVPQSTPLRNGQVSMRSVIPQNIERIEVIKGATAIYGNGADGGFINYITKKPRKAESFSGTSQIWTSSNVADTKDALGIGLSQSLSGTINKSGYFLNVFYEQTGNKYDAKKKPLYSMYGLDNTDVISVFGKFDQVFGKDDNQKITISSQYYSSKQLTPYGKTDKKVIVSENGNYTIEGGYGDLLRENKNGKSAGLETFNLLAHYKANDLFTNTDFQTDLYFQKSRAIFSYTDKFFKGGGQPLINSQKIGFRPYFISKVDIKNNLLKLTYGIDILKDKTNQVLLDDRLWIPDLELMSYAPYLQTKLKLDYWTIKTGVRYDNMNLTVPNYTTLPVSPKSNGNYTPSVNIKGGQMNFSNVSFNFGVRYTENPKFTPFVNFSQGYSMPDIGQNLRGATNPNILGMMELEAAKTNNYEFGFLSEYKHVKFEAVGYYSTSNIGTGLAFNNDTNRFEASKDPQKVFGYEVSLDMRFFNNALQSGVAYTFVEGLKSKKEDKNSTSYTFLGGDVVAPPKFTAYVSYDFTPKFNININLLKVSDRTRFNPIKKNNTWVYNYREVPVKGYTTLNLSASYEINMHLGVSLGVNNLLNAYYLPARSQWAAPIRNFTLVGEGINGKLGIVYKF